MKPALPLSEREFQARIERTQRIMSERGLEGLITFSSYAEREGHVCYLTNHRISFPNVLSHAGLGHAALILPVKGSGTLVSPLGYEAEKVVGIDQAKTGRNLVAELVAGIREKQLGERKLGVVGTDVIPVEYYERLTQLLPNATFETANDLLEGQRIIKSPSEIDLLRQSARVADSALKAGMEMVHEGLKRYDVELAVREAALAAGAEYIPRIRVSSGPKVDNTLCWPMSNDTVLAAGDMFFLDVIGFASNYGFDNSRVRTVGKPTSAQKDYINHLVEATEWMIGELKPGREITFVTTHSRGRRIEIIAHGIGLEIGENPWITAHQPVTLRPGMVLCVEPMVQSSEFGNMLVEETVVITKRGAEVLNQCQRVFW
jgi:Xaa-Pro aminopeptidase